MRKNADDPERPAPDRLVDLEGRVLLLESELELERQRVRSMQLRLATKEREIESIHRSRAWSLIAFLRSVKYRFIDPVLALFGVTWPRRRAVSSLTPPADLPVVQPFVAPPRANAFDVVCFAICDWDDRFQRPQQLMSLFAAEGHRVFYVRPQFRDDGPSWSVAPMRPNVYEVTLRGKALNVSGESLTDQTRDVLFAALTDLRREVSLQAAAIIVQFPFWWPLARQVRAELGWPVLYDCMDLHDAFANARQSMAVHENEMLTMADVVVTSSAALERRAQQKRDDVLLIRNGCDYEHFAKATWSANARPVIGYYGAIAEWFDSALVADLAARRPDWDFLLVGSTHGAALSRLSRLPNVSLPGEEPYASIPEWLSRFDVAIIPFKRTRLTEATNPVKVYEILAAGKPVVSIPIPEVAALAPLVRLASTAEEFERQIGAALSDDLDTEHERRAFAREHTWGARFDVLRSAAAAMLERSRQ